MPMGPAQDGEGHRLAKPPRRRKRRPVGRGTGSQKEEKKRRSAEAPPPPPSPPHVEAPPSPPPPPPSPPHTLRPASSHDDRSAEVEDMMVQRLRKMLAVDAEHKRQNAEFVRSISKESILSLESEFGDSDDGSVESLEARKVALAVSQSVISLSCFAGGKRIRVCSGFVMHWNDNIDTHKIITSASLIRSLNGDNIMIPNLRVKVLLPNGNITDGHIFLVDFHYNIAVVEVASDVKLLAVSVTKEIVNRGDVLALGRAYEGGNLMCSRGKILYQTSTFGCSELLTSSCKITMAGAGGPLVNYNGHVVGVNFCEKNQTSYLSIAIVSRVLDQHKSFGKIIRPWLGLRYSALETIPLAVLERVYQKFPDVDKGLYICNVAEGSPADAAGLRVGDVLVKCDGKILSTTPQFGVILLDTCKEHAEAHDTERSGDYLGNDIAVEVMIKQQRDGCTISKIIYAEVMKECHYNRWPAPMPRYKAHRLNVTPC